MEKLQFLFDEFRRLGRFDLRAADIMMITFFHCSLFLLVPLKNIWRNDSPTWLMYLAIFIVYTFIITTIPGTLLGTFFYPSLHSYAFLLGVCVIVGSIRWYSGSVAKNISARFEKK